MIDNNPVIHTVLLDMGNVLVDFVPMRFCAELTQDPHLISLLANQVFYTDAWVQLDGGELTEAEALGEILKDCPEELKDLACQAFEQWDTWMHQKQGMEEVLIQLKAKSIRLILCSNASVRYHRYTQNLSIFKTLDVCYFSCDLKLMKPEKDIFLEIQRREQLDFKSTLFVDDTYANIQTAQNLGMATYHFNGDVQSFKDYLRIINLI